MPSGHPHSFEDLLDEYECSWKVGAPLEIRSLISRWKEEGGSDEQTTADLLAELMMIALEYSWRQHDPRQTQPPPSGTLKTFDQELQQQLASAALTGKFLIEEFRSRHRWGDRPSLEEFERQYPVHCQEIRDELESLEQEYALETSIRKLFVESEEPDPERSAPELLEMSISDFLAGVYPFSELPGELKNEVAATALEITFSPGDYLMQQGSPSESLIVIMEGVAQVTIKPVETDEAEQELARVGAYSLLGEIGLLTGEVRSANIIALTPMKVAEIRYDSFRTLTTRFPTLDMLLSELVAQRVGTISTDIMFGKSLGGYDFRHRLGRGSMGIVYLAEDQQTGRKVAVKMLRHDLVYDRQASLRFRREAEVVRRLKHENIIEVYREFSAYNTFFLSMEYCRGCTLGDAIQHHAPFCLEGVRKIVGQLAAALHHAHSQGVIHRDLKPANVMLTEDGILKLTDFGLARSVECLKMTAHGQMLGTPRYMPSELLGGGEADERADLYALGAILWELLTGEALFTSGDIVSLLREQLQWQLPKADDIMNGLSDDLYGVLSETLSQDSTEHTLDLQSFIHWAGPINPDFCRVIDQPQEISAEELNSTIRLTDAKLKNLNDVSSTN